MLKEIIKEVKAIKSGTKEVQEFGLGGLIFFSVLAVLVLIIKHKIAWKLILLAVTLFIMCRLMPKVMRYVYIPAMVFATCMGALMSRVIPGILFYLTITPIALIGRLSGKKFLDLDFRTDADSYWVPKPKKEDVKKSCETQF